MSGSEQPTWRWDVAVKCGGEWDDFRVEAPHRAAAKQAVDIDGFDVEAIYAEPVRRVTRTEIRQARRRPENQLVTKVLTQIAEAIGL